MKNILLVALTMTAFTLVALISVAGERDTANAGASFNASIVYDGAYQPDMILFKNSLKATEWRRIPRLHQLYKVTCQAAVDSLKTTGMWQGHLNSKDGSCAGVEEPAVWATGNRLNYDRLREGDGN